MIVIGSLVNLGEVAVGSTVQFFWATAANSGASITRGTDGSLRIYKDGSDTQRASSSGITDTEDVDSLTGVHRCSIDLSNNADVGFYEAGSTYHVVLVGAVIDSVTVNVPIARFVIESSPVLRQSDVAEDGDLEALVSGATSNPVW